VVLSPHRGCSTPESLERVLDVVVANIERFLAGAPANIASATRQLFAIGNYVPFSELKTDRNVSRPKLP
jgi:hypothetical protein